MYRFTSEEEILEKTSQLIGILVTLPFTDSVFAIGAEVILTVKKAGLSEKGYEKLGKLTLKLILTALHCKHYRKYS